MSSTIRTFYSGLAVLLFSLSPHVLAQNPAVPDLTSLSIEDLSQIRLSTASRHLEDPRKAPSAVTVIGADEIRRYGWRTLAELLRSVTGFYSAYDRSYAYVGVRGFLQSGDYNARILLLVDGHRVNDNIYDSGLVGTEFPLDLSLIDRVEIVRGPGASLFGTNAELAVVNVFTRRPDNQPSVEITSSAESFLGRSAELRATLRGHGYSSILSGSIFRSNGAKHLYFPEFDSPDTNNGIATDLDGDRYSHAFGAVYRGRFRLEGLFGTRDKIVPNAPYQTLFGHPANRTQDTRGYVDASYSHSFTASTDLDLRTYYDAYRFWGSYPYASTDGSGPIVQIEDAAADAIGVEAVVGHKIGVHRIVAGFAGEHNFRVNQRNYYIGQKPYLDDHRSLTLGALFGEAELNPSSRLSFNIGGRVDWYTLYGTNLSPRIAAMYFPNAATSIKYIFGHAFRAPDPYDEFYVDLIDVTSTNSKLKPEHIDSHTLLLQRRLSENLTGTASLFLNQLNQIIKEQEDPLTGGTHFANEAGDSGRGAEFELIEKHPSGWSIRSSYTFQRTRSGESGKRVMNSPMHLAKLNGIAPLGRLASLGTEFLFTSSEPNFRGDLIPSSFLVNTTLSTRSFANGFQFSASCYNLLDRSWATPTGPEVSSAATEQDGRSWRFRLTYRPSIRRGQGKP